MTKPSPTNGEAEREMFEELPKYLRNHVTAMCI